MITMIYHGNHGNHGRQRQVWLMWTLSKIYPSETRIRQLNQYPNGTPLCERKKLNGLRCTFPLRNHNFQKSQNYTKNIQKIHFCTFSKLQNNYKRNYTKITSTFLLFSKLPKNYTKITFSIPTAPRSGAICILFVFFW